LLAVHSQFQDTPKPLAIIEAQEYTRKVQAWKKTSKRDTGTKYLSVLYTLTSKEKQRPTSNFVPIKATIAFSSDIPRCRDNGNTIHFFLLPIKHFLLDPHPHCGVVRRGERILSTISYKW
jgi:hypothetical protein